MQLRPELRRQWETLLDLKRPEELLDWVREQGGEETVNLEFKSIITHDHILKSCSAFGNSNGGILIIGVKDNPLKAGKTSPSDAFVQQSKSSYADIISILTNGFYYNSPLYQLEFLPNLDVFALLVHGYEREPIIYITRDRAIAGARRKESSSISFSVEETLASADRWHRQRDLVQSRYNNLPAPEQISESDLLNNRTALLFINALPIAPFARPIDTQQLDHVDGMLNYHAPAGLHKHRSTKTLFEFKASSTDTEKYSYDISVVQDGMFRVRVTGSNFEGIEFNKRLMLTAVYSAITISRIYDNSESWSIQGKYTIAESTTAHLIDPVFISLREHFISRDYLMPRIGRRCAQIQIEDIKSALEIYRCLEEYLCLNITTSIDWSTLDWNHAAWMQKLSHLFITS